MHRRLGVKIDKFRRSSAQLRVKNDLKKTHTTVALTTWKKRSKSPAQSIARMQLGCRENVE